MMVLNTLSLSVTNWTKPWVQCLSELTEEAHWDSRFPCAPSHSWSSGFGGKGK